MLAALSAALSSRCGIRGNLPSDWHNSYFGHCCLLKCAVRILESGRIEDEEFVCKCTPRACKFRAMGGNFSILAHLGEIFSAQTFSLFCEGQPTWLSSVGAGGDPISAQSFSFLGKVVCIVLVGALHLKFPGCCLLSDFAKCSLYVHKAMSVVKRSGLRRPSCSFLPPITRECIHFWQQVFFFGLTSDDVSLNILLPTTTTILRRMGGNR